MTLTSENIQDLGAELHRAWAGATAIDPLIQRYPDLSITDAYAVQLAMVAHRIDAGQRVVGKKIGVTSKVVMEMLKVNQPDFGHLLSDMAHADGAAISLARFIAPRAEGEIAFVMASDVLGPGLTNAEVLRHIDCVMPCLEIVDSRIRDWQISIADTIADNGSSGAFVLGDRQAHPAALDLRNIGMVLQKNGEIVGTGAGAAAMGHPLTCVTWLANQLGTFGIPLQAGEVILSGSLSIMFPVQPGDSIDMTLSGLGSCRARFTA